MFSCPETGYKTTIIDDRRQHCYLRVERMRTRRSLATLDHQASERSINPLTRLAKGFASKRPKPDPIFRSTGPTTYGTTCYNGTRVSSWADRLDQIGLANHRDRGPAFSIEFVRRIP